MAVFFRVKVGERIYELERLTLGDGVTLKRDFGLTDLENFNPADPETVLGLMTIAIARTDGLTISEARKQAEDIDLADFAPLEADAPEDPTSAADDAATESPSKNGGSGKRPKKPGVQN